MNKTPISVALSDWLVSWRARGLPEETLQTARYYVTDWLGSALAGQSTDAGKKLISYATLQPPGPCRVVGSDLTGSAELIALVNGGLSHIVEMDDLDRGSVVHPGAVIIPSALAIAERENASGCDFLSAVVAGYEVAIRIGQAVGKAHYHYFHNTSTCGVFGAAAAAGWLLQLTLAQMVWALGNAGTQASGLWQFNADGDMSKHLHAGRAAANGVLAADLARQDFTGARRILEGPRGFFPAMAPDADPDAVLTGLEQANPRFKIGGVSIKPFASCRHTHPAIDAALELRPQVDGPVARVTIDTYQAALDLCDNPEPETPYAAKFSLQYCVASALCRGEVGLSDFSPAAISSTEIRTLLPRIKPRLKTVLEKRYPAEWPVHLRIVLEDGRSVESSIDHPKGDPERRLSHHELEAKFRQLAEFGGHAGSTDDWLEWAASLESSAEWPDYPTE
jgi:2-methylcitrate dehydratase PrpD